MNQTAKSTFAAALTLLTFCGLAGAQVQVQVLESAQIAGHEAQLPALQNSVTQKDFKTYLQTLKPDAATSREIANVVRVADDITSSPLPADAFFGHYAVPAISPAMRLPDD